MNDDRSLTLMNCLFKYHSSVLFCCKEVWTDNMVSFYETCCLFLKPKTLICIHWLQFDLIYSCICCAFSFFIKFFKELFVITISWNNSYGWCCVKLTRPGCLRDFQMSNLLKVCCYTAINADIRERRKGNTLSKKISEENDVWRED